MMQSCLLRRHARNYVQHRRLIKAVEVAVVSIYIDVSAGKNARTYISYTAHTQRPEKWTVDLSLSLSPCYLVLVQYIL